MSLRRVVSVFAVVTFVAGFAVDGDAASGEQRCIARKLKAAASALATGLRCQARAARDGSAPSPLCEPAGGQALPDAFADIEARLACAVAGNAATVGDAIDAFVGEVTTGLAPSPAASGCAAAKLRAVGRATRRAIACHRIAARDGRTVDPACLSRSGARLLLSFTRVDSHADCLTHDDGNEAAAEVVAAAYELAALVETGTVPTDAAPSNLSASILGGTIHLGWMGANPASGHTHARLVRRLNAAPTDAGDPNAAVVFFGTATNADDDLTALLPDTSSTARTYHYAVFGCTDTGVCEAVGSRTSIAPTVTEALRGGGYVLHWRHASADVCADRTDLGTAATTSVPDWWKSCDAVCATATARQLNATGVAEAITIGDAFRTRDIPMGRVVSSEFCRNVETAANMDFGPAIEQSDLLTYFVYDEAMRCTHSYELLAEPPVPGTNTALIGHAGFTCPVLQSLAWGEAAIFKPDGAGATELVASVLWNQWATLP